MSRLWPDEVGVYVAPTRICLVRLARRWRPRLVREQELTLVSNSVHWEAPFKALEAKLADADWSGTRLRAVISDHWVRYAPVPHVAELSSAQEIGSHARALLANIYGDTVGDWPLTLSPEPPGHTRIACVMPDALLAELRNLCERCGTRLISVQPQLIAAYNCWRHRIPEEGAWFVTVEDGALGAARIGPRGVERVHTVRIGTDWTRELKRLQTFGRLTRSGNSQQAVYVDAPRSWRPVGLPASQDLQWLETGDEELPLTTLHRLERLRRLAA